MKATIEVELQPFQVPNFVMVVSEPKPREEGFVEGHKYKLSEIDADTLDRLCEDFRNAVFEKAGKSQPPKVMYYPQR